MAALHEGLLQAEPDLEFTVISPQAGRRWRKVEEGRTTHLLLPMKDVRRNRPADPSWWRSLPDSREPDVVHVHGTEYEFALPLVNATRSPVAVSVQGSVSRCGRVYLAGIPPRVLQRSSTLRSVVLRDSVLRKRDEFLSRGLTGEAPLLRAADVVIGRTQFDRELAAELAPDSAYEVCHEMLRPQFAAARWMPPHHRSRRVYISQASYPIKGFHRVVEALPAILAKHPDLEVVVAGSPPFPQAGGSARLRTSDYGRYIRRLMREVGVTHRVRFTGVLSADEVVEAMLHADVFWLPSAMENSSNALAEAMMLGMPVVAAATGGTPSMISHGHSGLLYDYQNVGESAACVAALLSDSSRAAQLGGAAREVALERHNPTAIVAQQLSIYRRMITRG